MKLKRSTLMNATALVSLVGTIILYTLAIITKSDSNSLSLPYALGAFAVMISGIIIMFVIDHNLPIKKDL